MVAAGIVMFASLVAAFETAHPLTIAAVLALGAFVALSALDGVWIHLWKLRLHARRESRGEHLFHTARAVLFVPMLVTVFTADTGSVFWIGLALVAADQLAEALDMLSEKDSRAPIGGLSSGEYMLHVLLTTVRTAAIVLAFVVRAPHLGAPASPELSLLSEVSGLLLPGAILVALLHVALALPRRIRATA